MNIILSSGKKQIELLVSPEDWRKLSLFKWYSNGNGYFYRADTSTGKRKNIYLHREILGVIGKEKEIDHINGNKSDNRRENLRIVSRSQNAMNVHKIKGFSKFKGVYFSKPRNKWVAQIRIFGKTYHIGIFIEEIAAAKAYDEKAKEIFREYAHINFPRMA